MSKYHRQFFIGFHWPKLRSASIKLSYILLFVTVSGACEELKLDVCFERAMETHEMKTRSSPHDKPGNEGYLCFLHCSFYISPNWTSGGGSYFFLDENDVCHYAVDDVCQFSVSIKLSYILHFVDVSGACDELELDVCFERAMETHKMKTLHAPGYFREIYCDLETFYGNSISGSYFFVHENGSCSYTLDEFDQSRWCELPVYDCPDGTLLLILLFRCQQSGLT